MLGQTMTPCLLGIKIKPRLEGSIRGAITGTAKPYPATVSPFVFPQKSTTLLLKNFCANSPNLVPL